MFLTFAGVFPQGATEEDLMRLYRPRPGLPFTPFQLGDGTKRLVWTTFTPQQVDVDVRAPDHAGEYLGRVLDRLAARGSRVRLDAVGYAVKTPGLSSFMTPETLGFIDDVTAWCRERGLEVLVEVHSYYRQQIEIAGRSTASTTSPFRRSCCTRSPRRMPTRSLAWIGCGRSTRSPCSTPTTASVSSTSAPTPPTGRAQGCSPRSRSTGSSRPSTRAAAATSRLATGAAASNVDLYQVNCTYYDALGRDDDRYLLARALQFLTPGVPQVYYVGLLAGGNDMDLLARTNVGRDVNRHHYDRDEIERHCSGPWSGPCCG